MIAGGHHFQDKFYLWKILKGVLPFINKNCHENTLSNNSSNL